MRMGVDDFHLPDGNKDWYAKGIQQCLRHNRLVVLNPHLSLDELQALQDVKDDNDATAQDVIDAFPNDGKPVFSPYLPSKRADVERWYSKIKIGRVAYSTHRVACNLMNGPPPSRGNTVRFRTSVDSLTSTSFWIVIMRGSHCCAGVSLFQWNSGQRAGHKPEKHGVGGGQGQQEQILLSTQLCICPGHDTKG